MTDYSSGYRNVARVTVSRFTTVNFEYASFDAGFIPIWEIIPADGTTVFHTYSLHDHPALNKYPVKDKKLREIASEQDDDGNQIGAHNAEPDPARWLNWDVDTGTAQLTIYYTGRIFVFDDAPANYIDSGAVLKVIPGQSVDLTQMVNHPEVGDVGKWFSITGTGITDNIITPTDAQLSSTLSVSYRTPNDDASTTPTASVRFQAIRR